MNPVTLAHASSGLFFLTGLTTGVWKYRAMITDADGLAPTYVDTCHRAALMYAFACQVLAAFAAASTWPAAINLAAVAASVAGFAAAVASYAVHAVVRDTDNQLRRPHRLGARHIHGGLVSGAVYALAVAEIGGFLVLFTGFLIRVSNGAIGGLS